MSYKHNNLMAMRQSYWNDNHSDVVLIEKQFFQKILIENGIFENASSDDAKYLFFSLPSVIIVKGYAHGFLHDSVKLMILQFIQDNKAQLMKKTETKVQYRM
nr:hypothetical protein [uncultured Acinetobacter sp.]